ARQYAKAQKIDDASPYKPNSFDVLESIGGSNKKVITFLKEIIQNDWGIPRWEAIEVLCRINDLTADEIIIQIIQGKYHPKYLDHELDIKHIEQIKGKNFIQRHT
ncbi:unnamed protein product, partial [marine sediment metagenome]